MSKVYNYMIVSVGLIFLLKFAGIIETVGILSWLGLSGNASGISLGTFFIEVAAIFTVGTGAGIAVSFITKSPSETYVIAPIALGIFTVMATMFLSIINLASIQGTFVYYIVWMIFVPLLVSFGVAIIQFWRGND